MTARDDLLFCAVVTLRCVLRGTFDADLFFMEHDQLVNPPYKRCHDDCFVLRGTFQCGLFFMEQDQLVIPL